MPQAVAEVAVTPAIDPTPLAQAQAPAPAAMAKVEDTQAVTDAELKALGWGVSQQPAPAPAIPALSNKMQVFGKAPATPQQDAPSAEPYTRQAAANLIGRLRKNPGRIEKEGMSKLKAMVFDESRKSELISLLCSNNGNLSATSATLVVTEERGESESQNRRALRLTAKQMTDMYGDKAATVMKFKEDNGMTETDPNCPDMLWYLQEAKDDAHSVHKSQSVSLDSFQLIMLLRQDLARAQGEVGGRQSQGRGGDHELQESWRIAYMLACFFGPGKARQQQALAL